MKTIFIILIACVLTSCGKPQDKLRTEIESSETELLKDSMMTPDTLQAAQLISRYISYADQFKDDTLAPEYLFRAADLSTGIGHYKESISLLGRIDRYPNYRKYPSALFLKGFISETRLNDTASAHRYYEQFIDKYPEHKLADDARASINNMGISPEDLVKQFEQRIADSSAVTH